MTRLGLPVHQEVAEIRAFVTKLCVSENYKIIDASTEVTGRDFLLKIWKLIASSPISIGVCHEKIPPATLLNIYYELGVAQALGKETIIIKSKDMEVPSDFIRTEYIEFNDKFEDNFLKFLRGVAQQAEYYERIADQLERNPVLALDYLRRAFLITSDEKLRQKAKILLGAPGLKDRAKNSVEMLVASF